jgi:hypothetical protein
MGGYTMVTQVLKQLFLFTLLLFTGLLLSGFALQQDKTEQGLYFVALEFPGTQVKVGNNSMKLFIGDKRSKAPLKEKTAIEIVPWMPAHEHGTSDLPIVKELGKGYYSVERVNFTMSGLWEIYVRINKGSKGEDTAVFNINVK